MICLNWAQSILDEGVIVYKHAYLNFIRSEYFTNGNNKVPSAKFELELRFDQKKPKAKRQIRRGSHLKFRSVPDNKVLPIPVVSIY